MAASGVPPQRPLPAPPNSTDAATVQLPRVDVVETGRPGGRRDALSPAIVDRLQVGAPQRLPAANLLDALQRMPGITAETDQGEGRFLVVRGLGPQLNSVRIGGVELLSGEEDSRQTGLDLLPSTLFDALAVHKSFAADADAGALGAVIDLQPLAPLAQPPGRALGVESRYQAPESAWAQRIDARLDRQWPVGEARLGLSLALDLAQQDDGWEGIESSAGWPRQAVGASAIPTLAVSEQRDYRAQRDRRALAFAVEWIADDGGLWRLHGLHAGIDETLAQALNRYRFEDGETTELDAEAASFVAAGFDKQRTDRLEQRRLATLTLSRRWQWALGELELQLARSQAGEREPEHLDTVFSQQTALGYRRGRPPQLLALSSDGFDPAAFALDRVIYERTDIDDGENQLGAAVRQTLASDGPLLALRWGGKLRRRERRVDLDFDHFTAADSGLALSSFAGTRDYRLGEFGPAVAGRGLRAALAAVRDRLEFDVLASELSSNAGDYRMDEDIDAVYLLGEFGGVAWAGELGLRLERSEFRARGQRVELDAEADRLRIDPIDARQRDRQWLPSAALRRELVPGRQLRLALGRGLSRPGFGELAPAQRIEIERDDEDRLRREGEFGNPQLRPMRAINLELALDQQSADGNREGTLSLYAKRITDFIVLVDHADESGFAGFERALQPINGSRARVQGIELAFHQRLNALPAPWDGLWWAGNVQLSSSSARLPLAARTLPLPLHSRRSGSLMLGYAAARWSWQIALHLRSRRLLALEQPEDPAFDVYESAYRSLDARLLWRLDEHWQLSLDALNLSNRALYEYYGSPRFHARYEVYGRRWLLGLRYRY